MTGAIALVLALIAGALALSSFAQAIGGSVQPETPPAQPVQGWELWRAVATGLVLYGLFRAVCGG